MKYHGHEIKCILILGKEERLIYTYDIYKDGEYIGTALTLLTAKTYIDRRIRIYKSTAAEVTTAERG